MGTQKCHNKWYAVAHTIGRLSKNSRFPNAEAGPTLLQNYFSVEIILVPILKWNYTDDN